MAELGTLTVHGGTLPRGHAVVESRGIRGCNYLIRPSHIAQIQVLTQQNSRSVLKTAAWATVGGALFGQVGMLTGALAGGTTNQVTFAVALHDGGQFIATTDATNFARLAGAALTNRTRQQPRIAANQDEFLEALQPAEIENAREQLAFLGWDEDGETESLKFLEDISDVAPRRRRNWIPLAVFIGLLALGVYVAALLILRG